MEGFRRASHICYLRFYTLLLMAMQTKINVIKHLENLFTCVGVTVWEILTFSARPYPNLTARQLLGALYNGVRLEQPVTCSHDLYRTLSECKCVLHLIILIVYIMITGWLVDDKFRPTFSDLESTMSVFSANPTQYVLTVVGVSVNQCHSQPQSYAVMLISAKSDIFCNFKMQEVWHELSTL